jgi:hypothetical protein
MIERGKPATDFLLRAAATRGVAASLCPVAKDSVPGDIPAVAQP